MVKRIIGSLVLTLCVCTMASAQNDGDFYDGYKKFLDREHVGYQIDEDGDLVFKFQGGNFFISRSADDPNYLQLNMPGIYSFPEEEMEEGDRLALLLKVMEAINEVNANTKVVKAYLVNDKSVWLTTETFMDESPELGDFFFRLLDSLHGGRQRFSNAMNNLN